MRKKLIEVALPLDKINEASVREKSIRHGHPSTLHLYWARRPLATARAVIFGQMVDDPSAYTDELLADADTRRHAERALPAQIAAWRARVARREAAQASGDTSAPDPGPEPTVESCAIERERERLFRIIERLVMWENTTNEEVLEEARVEIRASWRRTCAAHAGHPQAAELFDPDRLPPLHDPFAGGGSIPLEAQRLGFEAHASDLNPVAVLINKAMIEIPPRFAGRPPVNPAARAGKSGMGGAWKGAAGLADDVRYYGQWMRDEAEKRIGHLYPKVAITAEMARTRPDLKPLVGQSLTVVAWLWARTVKSPNPAFAHVDVPLASTFMLSTKDGKEAYVQPVISGVSYRFEVRTGKPADPKAASAGTSAGTRQAFKCLMSGVPMSYDYIRGEGKAGRMGSRLMAIVGEGARGRVYLEPDRGHEALAISATPTWKPSMELPDNTRDFKTPLYGLTNFGDLFTNRQLVALTTFSDLVAEAQAVAHRDAIASGLPGDGVPLRDGGRGALAYGEAVGVYLAFCQSKCTDYWSSICSWHVSGEKIRNTFGRQAIPMVWDYAETNPFSDSTGNWSAMRDWTRKAISALPLKQSNGQAIMADVQTGVWSEPRIISIDPPYYDNIGYADLSDFFYVWIRQSLRKTYPELFATLATPKAEELISSPYRHGGKDKAEAFFLDGMTAAMTRLGSQAHPGVPVTIYYAFKQSETDADDATSSTGWATFLEAVIRAGFAINGTWPMRTEMGNRMIGAGANALASCIVLVCRPRAVGVTTITVPQFLRELRRELPDALRAMRQGNVAPVDLAQASIGPGMAIFSRHSSVTGADGKPMPVSDALKRINEVLDEVLAEQEGDFDADTRFAIAWFETHGFVEGDFGTADTLARAKNTSVEGIAHAGIVQSGGGKVRLLRPSELPTDWDPATDTRRTVWEATHHLIRVLEAKGEAEAGALARRLGGDAEVARDLAYRLFAICERKNRSVDARSYNALVQSWGGVMARATEQVGGTGPMAQPRLV